MEDKTEDIGNWIKETSSKMLNDFDAAFSKEFGYITMANGKKAQIQITLEMDDDDWI